MANPDSQLAPLATWQRRAAAIAVAGLLLCVLLTWQQPDMAWRAYLFAFLACWMVTIGGTGLLALGNLTGGRWATFARPYYLSAAQLLPHTAVLFIPIALTLDKIYPWATGSGAELNLAAGKAWYLEPTFFLQRAVAYFVVWLLIGALLSRVSRFDCPAGELTPMSRAGALSLVLLVPTASFAAFDWGMSLEPLWYSSIYGAICAAAGVLAAHGLAIWAVLLLRADRWTAPLAAAGIDTSNDHEEPAAAAPPRGLHEPPLPAMLQDVLNDMGNLLLAFLMVCMYFSFSQFLIIWSGNLPSEISWYLRRLEGGWQWLALVLVALHFFVPFVLLLSRERKRSPRPLAKIAILILAMFALHVFWMIVPAFAADGLSWFATNVAALAAIGGLWMMLFFWNTRRNLLRLGPRGLPSEVVA